MGNIFSKITNRKYSFKEVVVCSLGAIFLLLAMEAYLILGGSSRSTYYFLKMTALTKLIDKHYIEDIKREKLYEGALSGIVHSLGDPFSNYLNAQQYAHMVELTDGHFSGVGIVLGVVDKKFVIVSPIEDSPAQAAGIQSGDYLLAVDGMKTQGLAIDVVVSKIRGANGTEVELTVETEGERARKVKLMRSDIKLKSIGTRPVEDGIGYIRIKSFDRDTGKDFASAIKELESQGMQGLILDLRNNPGGLLSSGVAVAQQLVPAGPIVSVREKDGRSYTYSSSLKQSKYPIAVLVNGGSASASEIVAGALQDTGAGVLIGTKTYGKGVVQAVYPMGNDTAVSLTMAKYYTPKERCIHGEGLKPDKEVQAEDKKATNQLNVATDYLQQKLAMRQASSEQ